MICWAVLTMWDKEKELAYTGKPEWHAVYTIQLGELIESGVFDWNMPILDWSESAYSFEQYTRVCSYFMERFEFREISLIPFYEWAKRLRYKLVYELMPKYRPLYASFESGINPLADYDEYYKEREITSAYPETMLSGNSDYASDGKDIENERIRLGNVTEREQQYMEGFRAIDSAMLDELECMFTCMYTSNVNAL